MNSSPQSFCFLGIILTQNLQNSIRQVSNNYHIISTGGLKVSCPFHKSLCSLPQTPWPPFCTILQCEQSCLPWTYSPQSSHLPGVKSPEQEIRASHHLQAQLYITPGKLQSSQQLVTWHLLVSGVTMILYVLKFCKNKFTPLLIFRSLPVKGSRNTDVLLWTCWEPLIQAGVACMPNGELRSGGKEGCVTERPF